MIPSTSGLTYAQAGVDVRGADALMQVFGALAKATHTAGVRTHKLGYAGLHHIGSAGDLLAATCDGVGTKLIIAREMQQGSSFQSYAGLGQDLVAMSVNDLLPVGAKPLFFLDYIATGKLNPPQLTAIVASVAEACRLSGCALLGGETAEMPSVYNPTDFDLAGFAVGLTHESRLPNRDAMRPGDVLWGLPSSGIHSNGLSLARRALLGSDTAKLLERLPGSPLTIGGALLTPTALYVDEVLSLWDQAISSDLSVPLQIRGAAHITGGGLLRRLHQLLPATLGVDVDLAALAHESDYTPRLLFSAIAESGQVSALEMASTFNLGIGFAAVVASTASALGAPWLRLGHVDTSNEIRLRSLPLSGAPSITVARPSLTEGA